MTCFIVLFFPHTLYLSTIILKLVRGSYNEYVALEMYTINSKPNECHAAFQKRSILNSTHLSRTVHQRIERVNMVFEHGRLHHYHLVHAAPSN